MSYKDVEWVFSAVLLNIIMFPQILLYVYEYKIEDLSYEIISYIPLFVFNFVTLVYFGKKKRELISHNNENDKNKELGSIHKQ